MPIFKNNASDLSLHLFYTRLYQGLIHPVNVSKNPG